MLSIRLARCLLRIPQGVLAKRAGISVRTLIRIEKLQVFPRIEIIMDIDKALTSIVMERLREAAPTREERCPLS